jgi:hypothetical protein
MNELNATEALFGFCGWLTSRDEKTVMGSKYDAGVIAGLIKTFMEENKLSDVRDGWENNLIHPNGECSHSKTINNS